MKIGLVRRGYSGTGGAEAYVRRFADAARAAGHSCILFGSDEWAAAEWPGKKQIITGATPRAFADALRDAKPREHCDLLFSLERVWECDAYRAGDGVHAAWLDRRRAFEPGWRGWFRARQQKHRELLELERALFTGGAGRVIANSQLVKNEIIARFSTPPERIEVIHNGIPPWRDEPGLREKTRTSLCIAPDDFAVLFAGSGWERKGLRFALAAMADVPGILFVAGHGSHRGLPRFASPQFLGPQSRDKMRALLAAADAFVLPTIYEPFSNACLEALSAGLPVITTTANGFAEIIEPGIEGEITEPGDIPALTRALMKWADPAKRAAIRARLLAKGAQHTIKANVARTLEALTAPRRET